MSPIGAISSSLMNSPPLASPGLDGTGGGLGLGIDGTQTASKPADGFGNMIDGLIQTVATKETQASQLAQQVMLGGTAQLHQSVIAMQEASVAFSLMVQVRNKLVESYQELMRMQV